MLTAAETCALLVGLVALPLRLRSMLRHRPLAAGRRRHRWTAAGMALGVIGVYAGTALSLLAGAATFAAWSLTVGAAAFAAGVWLRAVAIRTLGVWFSPHIEIRDRQQLVQEGPFRYMRHPNYAGLLLEAVGLPLAFGAPAVLAYVAVVFVPSLIFRIALEEQEMVVRFGESYMRYQRTVGAIFPTGGRRRRDPAGERP